jgi:hypothetical protein
VKPVAAAASCPLPQDDFEIAEDPTHQSAPSSLLTSLKLILPESLTPQSSAEWSNWIAEELALKLVGVSAKTSRAKVRKCNEHLHPPKNHYLAPLKLRISNPSKDPSFTIVHPLEPESNSVMNKRVDADDVV